MYHQECDKPTLHAMNTNDGYSSGDCQNENKENINVETRQECSGITCSKKNLQNKIHIDRITRIMPSKRMNDGVHEKGAQKVAQSQCEDSTNSTHSNDGTSKPGPNFNSLVSDLLDRAICTDDTESISNLQREKAKVKALVNQLEKSLNENQQLQDKLSQTQMELEKQMLETLRIKKSQLKRRGDQSIDAGKMLLHNENMEVENLTKDLETSQLQLAKEMSVSTRREERLQRVVEKCEKYEKELETLRSKDERCDQSFIKNLEHQRSELLGVVKRQMKLIEILKQQRVHAQAATMLNIIEKDFMRVGSSYEIETGTTKLWPSSAVARN